MVLNSNTLDFLWLQDGEQGTPGADGSSLYTWVKYSQAADGSHMTDDPTDAVYIGIAYNKTSATESTDPEDYSWSKIKGENGDDGTDGEDAYTIILTNENVSFSTDKTNLPLTNQSATCGILVYKGATPITTYTIGRVTAPTGIGVSQTTNSIILSVSTSVTVPNDNGQVQVPITIGDITLTKQIAYSLSKQGDDGRGISSTAVHYIASTNGVSPPPLTANWLNEIPVLQAGEYLWTRTTTNYTDGTSLYGYSVSKDGRGVATVTNEYRISKSNTNPDAGRSDGSVSNWNAVRPTDVGTDEYLWIRYKYTYDDGSSPTYSDAIYDSTIDGISSILDTENRTLKDTVWETAYFNVVDPDTGEVIQMNIKNTIVESVTDITGIEQRVSTTETNLGDFTNSEYTLFKQSVNQFQTEVSDNLNNTTTIATQTAEDFSWLFAKNIYDSYLVDDKGNFVIDENGEFIKATNEGNDGSARISFTRDGIKMVNGIIEIKAPDGETTVVQGGQINTNRIVSVSGNSWINLGLGTFDYGDKLVWDGSTLKVEGEIHVLSGNIATGIIIGEFESYHSVMSANAFNVYGVDGSTIIASFGEDGSILGDINSYHAIMDIDSFDIYGSDGNIKLATFGEDTIIGNLNGESYLRLKQDNIQFVGETSEIGESGKTTKFYIGKTPIVSYSDYPDGSSDMDRNGSLYGIPDLNDYVEWSIGNFYQVTSIPDGKFVKKVITKYGGDTDFVEVLKDGVNYLYVHTPFDVEYVLGDIPSTRTVDNRTYYVVGEWDDYFPERVYPDNDFITYGSQILSTGKYIDYYCGKYTPSGSNKPYYKKIEISSSDTWISAENTLSGEVLNEKYYKLGVIPETADPIYCTYAHGLVCDYIIRTVNNERVVYVNTVNGANLKCRRIMSNSNNRRYYTCLSGDYDLAPQQYMGGNSTSIAGGNALGENSVAILGTTYENDSISLGKNKVYGEGAVALGAENVVWGLNGCAIGTNNICETGIYPYSYAIGSNNVSGQFACTFGNYLEASGIGSTAIGLLNVDDPAYIFMVGNGYILNNGGGEVRSNALTVDRDGALAVADVTNTQKNLGIVAGAVAATSVAANTYTDYTVSFGKTFSAAPVVVVGFYSDSVAPTFGRCCCSVYDVSTTGCTIRVFNGDTVSKAPAMRWIAVGH